jgi:hypothetical protein
MFDWELFIFFVSGAIAGVLVTSWRFGSKRAPVTLKASQVQVSFGGPGVGWNTQMPEAPALGDTVVAELVGREFVVTEKKWEEHRGIWWLLVKVVPAAPERFHIVAPPLDEKN